MTETFRRELLSTTSLSPQWPRLRRVQVRQPPAPVPTEISVSVKAPPLGNSERGLVISNPLQPGPGNSFTMGYPPALDPQELRFSLLFWDRLDFPLNNVFHMENSPEVEFLISAGVLTRSLITASGELTKVPHQGLIRVFTELDARDAGRWSIARGEKSLGFLPSELIPHRGVLLKLHQAIPVPNVDVPLHDILQFKERRFSELQALRDHLDKTYLEIINSPDRAFAEIVALEKIDRATSAVLRVGKESGLRFKLASFEAKLDVLDFVKGGFAASLAAQAELPLTAIAVAGIAGAFAPSLSLTSGVGLKGRVKSATPFEYVSQFHRDLF